MRKATRCRQLYLGKPKQMQQQEVRRRTGSTLEVNKQLRQGSNHLLGHKGSHALDMAISHLFNQKVKDSIVMLCSVQHVQI